MPNLLLELSQVVRNSGVQLSSHLACSAADPPAHDRRSLSRSPATSTRSPTCSTGCGPRRRAQRRARRRRQAFHVGSIGLTPTGAGRALNGTITLTTSCSVRRQRPRAAAGCAPATPPSTDTSAPRTPSPARLRRRESPLVGRKESMAKKTRCRRGKGQGGKAEEDGDRTRRVARARDGATRCTR